jgi:alpha-tubulin suppressor-like RCC1 family protein
LKKAGRMIFTLQAFLIQRNLNVIKMFLSLWIVCCLSIALPKLVNARTLPIAAGVYHTVALKANGTVWAWGRNYYGQLGNGSNSDRNTPVQVSGLIEVTGIAAGRVSHRSVETRRYGLGLGI